MTPVVMPDQIELAQLEAPAGVCVRRRSWRDVSRLAVHPLLRNVGLTGLASLVTSLAAVVVISLIGRTVGPVLLGEYLLLRRMASWLQAIVVLPSGIALPRYVAASVDDSASRQTYFLGAVVTSCGLALLLTAILVLWKVPVGRLIFGSAELAPLTLPLGLLLLGLAAHGAAFGFYQGTLSMGRACTMQVFNLAIFPVLAVVLLARERSISMIVGATGIAMTVCALVFSIPILGELRWAHVAPRAWKHVSELLWFGLSRAWGDFGLQALLGLPAVIAAHYVPMRSVGFLLLGGSLLSVVSAATLPLGIILLSHVTRALAQGRAADLRDPLAHFADALIGSSFFVSLQMLVFADVIIRIWVGPDFAAATGVVRLLIVAVPFYFVYGGLRSVVDAAAVKAHNTRNILISLAVFLVTVAAVRVGPFHASLLAGLAVSVVVSMAVLCWLTLKTMQELFQLRVSWGQGLVSAGFAGILGAASFLLHSVLHFQPNFAILALYELAVSGAYFTALWLFGSPWLRFSMQAMFSAQWSRPEPAQ
jgi:O-antigen/teichoic acid export membrane protein